MKKLFYVPAIILSLGVCLTSCKDNTEREENATEVTEIDEIGTEDTGKDEIAYSEFREYDVNSDGMYDRSEYKRSFKSEFSKMDADGNGSLNKEEFNAAIHMLADTDRNNSVSEEEWKEGNEKFLSERTGKNKEFSAIDTNSDNKISLEEWKKGFEQTNWFSSYDKNKDELIQEDEWDNGLFDDWDLDNDGFWNEEEFNSTSSATEEEL